MLPLFCASGLLIAKLCGVRWGLQCERECGPVAPMDFKVDCLVNEALAALAAEVVCDGVEWEQQLVLHPGLFTAGHPFLCGGKIAILVAGR